MQILLLKLHTGAENFRQRRQFYRQQFALLFFQAAQGFVIIKNGVGVVFHPRVYSFLLGLKMALYAGAHYVAQFVNQFKFSGFVAF